MKHLLLIAMLLAGLAFGCSGGGSANNQSTATDSAMNGLYKVRPRVQQPAAADSLVNYHPAATHGEIKADSVIEPVSAAYTATATRPLRPSERTQVFKQLNQWRLALNATARRLNQDSARIKAKLTLPLPATEQAHYKLLLEKQRQRTAAFLLDRASYRRNYLALKEGRRLLALDEARRLGIK